MRKLQAMTRADGERLEVNLRREVDLRFDAVDAKFDTLDSKLDAMQQKLIAAAWTVGGAAVGVLIAFDYFA